MFSREGSARSERQNRAVAGYLAFVGGFVNSAGYVLVGAFTSHVTGNVGRMADAATQQRTSTALEAAGLVGAFFLGAMMVGTLVESHAFARRSLAYASALAIELVLLLLIAGGFTSGAVAGAFAAVTAGRASMLVPLIAVIGCALYAARDGRSSVVVLAP